MNLFDNLLYQQQLCKVCRNLPDNKFSILVTGASGLVGSFLIDSLIYANRYLGCQMKVFALGRNMDKLEKRFNYVCKSDNLHLISANITQPLDSSIHYDYIIHAASNADPKSYALYPTETLLTNVIGTKSVLDYAKEHKETRVLLTSTFEVYGDAGKKGIITEDSTGIIDFHVLRNCYPSSKVCAELLCQCYLEEYGVNYVIGRLGGIYGPTMLPNDSKAQAQFIKQAVARENIVLKSKGDQKRSYCYVADAVYALLTILFFGKTGEAYNIADDSSMVTIAQFAETVADVGNLKVVFQLPSDIELKGFSKPVDVVLDNEKLKSIGWTSLFNLREGVSNTISILRDLD